jgi:hypothetical protein
MDETLYLNLRQKEIDDTKPHVSLGNMLLDKELCGGKTVVVHVAWFDAVARRWVGVDNNRNREGAEAIDETERGRGPI